MCGCCKSHGYLNSNKVLPGRSDQVKVKRTGRTNGWTFPPHPLQILGWLFIIVFAVTHFAILVFYLPIDWVPAGIIIPAAGFVIHLAYHILALTLDPADPAVRVKGIFERGVFDRSKQNHVIENCYCYICQTKVSSTSKHCSMCNKCIFDFDHHCKWLNNCVGGRNYKLFLGSCLSAFGTALAMFIIDVYLLVTYAMDSENYLKKSGVKQYQLFPDLLVDKQAYIIFDSVNGFLLLVALVLLGHLLVFHGYLICNKLSTYDYIVKSRQKKAKDVNSDAESAGEPDLPPKALDPLTSSHPPHSSDSLEHRIYEMDVYTGPEKTIEENEIASRRESYDYYSARETSAHSGERDSRHIYESAADTTSSRETFDKKKRRRVKSRNSSQLELLENERIESMERSGDEPDGYLSSKGSTQSIRSRDQADVRSDNDRKSDIVLEDYSTPKMTRSSRVSAKETYEDDDEEEEDNSSETREYNRNESVASRPRSPSPTQTQRLSYLKQSYYANSDIGRVPSRLMSTAEEVESIQSKSSHDFEKRIGNETGDSGFGQYDDIGSPVLSTTKSTSISRAGVRNNTDTQSDGSQLSLSNAMTSNREDDDGDDDDNATRRLSPVSRRSDTSHYQKMEQPHSDERLRISEVVSAPTTASAVYNAPINNLQSTNNAVQSADEQLVFEDEFVDDMTGNNNGIFDQPDVNRSLPPPPYPSSDAASMTTDNQMSDADEATRKKFESYVDAFRRKKDSTYSYGSDSERSEMAIAVLNEETDPSDLKDSLYRVNKLSDAFPTVVDQEAFKNRSLQQPRLRDTESMEELSVVEYNRKKKLKKKRASSSNDHRPSNLPPLRGRKPLWDDTSDATEGGRNPDV